MCTYVGCKHNNPDIVSQESRDRISDTVCAQKLSEKDIEEITRMADSIRLYGVKEGVKRFYKDSVQITDEDSLLIMNMMHGILDDLNYNIYR